MSDVQEVSMDEAVAASIQIVEKKTPCSKFSGVTLTMFPLGLIMGTGCILKTHDAEREREYLEGEGIDITDDEEYMYDRQLALGMGCAAGLFFVLAVLFAALAGMRHGKRKDRHCCVDFLQIGGWIIGVLTFVISVALLVMAFNPETVLLSGCVWVSFIGSIISWTLMFAYSELARKL